MLTDAAPAKRAKRFYRSEAPRPMTLTARDINLLAHVATNRTSFARCGPQAPRLLRRLAAKATRRATRYPAIPGAHRHDVAGARSKHGRRCPSTDRRRGLERVSVHRRREHRRAEPARSWMDIGEGRAGAAVGLKVTALDLDCLRQKYFSASKRADAMRVRWISRLPL